MNYPTHPTPEFDPTFKLTTGHARIEVGSETAYRQRHGDTRPALNTGDVVRLTDDNEAHLLLAPAEALTLAAALQAVAVHLPEQNSREVTA